jgi:hypothetical protein
MYRRVRNVITLVKKAVLYSGCLGFITTAFSKEDDQSTPLSVALKHGVLSTGHSVPSVCQLGRQSDSTYVCDVDNPFTVLFHE